MIAKNEILEDIVDNLRVSEPRWDEVINKFKQTNHYRGRKYNDHTLRSLLGETFLHVMVEKISSNYNGLINNRPFGHENQSKITKHYKFKQDSFGNLYVSKHGNNGGYCEIDKVITINKLPVIFEVKLSRESSASRKKKCPSSHNLKNLMGVRRLNLIHDPIKEYFGSEEFGYVIMTYPMMINDDHYSITRFKRNNGLLVPFYADKSRFESDLKELREKYDI